MKKAFALFLAMASSIAPALAQDNAAAIGELMQAWQTRIVAQNLPVEDAKNWARRNMAKFGRLSAERLALAQRAATLEELELLLVEAPVADGARLDVLMANKPGNISMMGARNDAKLTPATSPAAYAGLVFTSVTPCRILDSRVSQGGSGAWAANTSNLVKIGPYATGYQTGAGAQGGSSTSCGLNTLAGPGQIAVISAAVSTVSQTGQGYLTLYPTGAPNPGTTTVSQYFQPGYVQTSFVLIATDLSGAVTAQGYTSATTDVIIDVVGYFMAEGAEGTVTSITAGTGLTGGTITTSGTIGLAATNLLPTVACATSQIPKWSGSAWACAADNDTNSGGTVTGVTASAPIASSGGAAPNISLTGAVAVANGGTGQTTLTNRGVLFGQGSSAVGTAVGLNGQLLAGSAGAPVWTGSPAISGSLILVDSTASAGNIMKGTDAFFHSFGNHNIFVGQGAGNFTMTAQENVAVGYLALSSVTNGFFNTAIGSNTLVANTSGITNVAAGYQAMVANVSGSNNAAIGAHSLQANTSGASNTALGAVTLAQNTTGGFNVAAGESAIFSNTSGSNNVAYGAGALVSNTIGNGNIALGYQAGFLRTTGSFNIDIGNVGAGAEGNTIRIGDANQTRTFVSGIRGVTTGVANGIPVLIDSNGQLGTVSSSRHVKDDIADMSSASNALMKLRPVTFHYKSDHSPAGRTLQYGLIAEEVAGVYPGLIAHSADGKIETVMYQFLPPMLLNEVQKQQQRIAALESEIAELRSNAALTARLLEDLRQHLK